MTVRELLEHIEKNNIPMDAEVYTQRVEDVYFEKYNWSTSNKKGFDYYTHLDLINKAKRGEFNNKEDYPKMNQSLIDGILKLESCLDDFMEKYIHTHCAVKYEDDNNLYINCHY